jgi:DNA-directed RNA polymerase beta' subunit
VKAEIKSAKAALKEAPPSNVNKLNTKIKYLKALNDLDMKPNEAYLMSKVPVIPPQYRPIYPLPSGDLMVSDINKHYRDIGLVSQNYKKVKKI